MDAAYLKAAHPEPHRILGTDLEPFCMGHEILLQRFKNKFSIECKDEPGIYDLLTAVFLCSQPYKKNRSLNGFKVPFRATVMGKVFGKPYIETVKARFQQYIADHTEIPDFYSKDGHRDFTGTPTIQAVKLSLMANMGDTEEQALNKPFSLAFWDHLGWLEGQGVIQIIDDAERARIKKSEEDYKRIEPILEEIARKMVEENLRQEAIRQSAMKVEAA
jgi:hypothetical protein